MVLAIRTVRLFVLAALLVTASPAAAKDPYTPKQMGKDFAFVVAAIKPCRMPQERFRRIRRAQLIVMRLEGITYPQIQMYELFAIQSFALIFNKKGFSSAELCRDIEKIDKSAIRMLKAVEKLEKKKKKLGG